MSLESSFWKRRYRLLTAPLRCLPNSLIIGTQRGGTTTLYSYLLQHPNISPALTKEVHYFDLYFRNGTMWYRAHFPFGLYEYVQRVGRQAHMSGEASPYYIFHPRAPYRVAETVPRARIIALLRNPVDRAYSHYWHEVRLGRESLSFEEAIEKEAEQLKGEAEKMQADESYNSFNHRRYSYLARGIYVDQLKVWMSLFSSEQILLLKSEDLFADPGGTMRHVLDFLGLQVFQPEVPRRDNVGGYPPMDPATRRWLREYFSPHVQRLQEYLHRDLNW